MNHAKSRSETAAILLVVCVGAWLAVTGAISAKTVPGFGGAAVTHASTILDEFNGFTLGVANGITFAPALDGEGAVFSRAAGSYIQYPQGIPRQGTLEWWIKVDSGYSYHNFVLSAGQTRALIFTTDIAGGDVTWPGSAWLWVSANGDITFSLATTKYAKTPPQLAIARGTPFRFSEWHSIGISYGSEGQAIMVDGQLVASQPGNTQWLGSGGNHFEPVDLPTIGESVSGFWRPHQYSGGFDGIVDRFRASAAQRDWALSAVDPTARTSARRATTFVCANATDLGYSLSAGGRMYRVKAVNVASGKQIPILMDEQGKVVRNGPQLLEHLEKAAWTRENIIASASTRAELAQKDVVLSNAVETLQALSNYQSDQDLLARAAVTALEATVTGGTSLPTGLAQLTAGELEHQLEESPRTLLTLTAEEGLMRSKALYDQLTTLLYPENATVLDVARLRQIYTLFMEAHTLELPSEALATALSPEYASQLTQQALDSVVSQTLPKLGPINPAATVTLDLLLKTQQGLAEAASTQPVLKGYQMNLNLALNLAKAYQRQISTWATEAAQISDTCTSATPDPSERDETLLPFCRTSAGSASWGYINLKGTVLVPSTYRSAAEFSDGLGRLQFPDGKWGFLDPNGKIAIPPEFDNEGDFHEGVARVMVPGGRSGFVNQTGSYTVAPTIGEGPHAAGWWGVQDFSDGLAEITELNGRSGWIDKNGRLVLPQPTEDGGYWVDPTDGRFGDGLVVLGFSPKHPIGPSIFGYMNKAGEFAIPPRFSLASRFSEGLAAVALGKGPDLKFGYIDPTGNVVVNFQFSAAERFSEGLAAVELSGKYGYIDRNGKFVIDPRFDDAKPFSGGLAAVLQGGKWGFIDKPGKMRIAPQFNFAFTNIVGFSRGVALVQLRSGGYAYIDREGKVIASTCTLPDLPSR